MEGTEGCPGVCDKRVGRPGEGRPGQAASVFREADRSVCVLSCLTLTLWTAARQAPLSMGVSRQEDWGGLPCPPPGDL